MNQKKLAEALRNLAMGAYLRNERTDGANFDGAAAASAAPSGRHNRPDGTPCAYYAAIACNKCGWCDPAPPEQAQETCGFPGCISPQAKPGWGPHNRGANGFPKGPHASHHQWTPPEQARRTWTLRGCKENEGYILSGSDITKGEEVVVVHLRPGERIVSGEGVRECFNGPSDTPVEWHACNDKECRCHTHRRVIALPDAPPRAEGE
jgi:hypothetical protein